MLLTENYIVKDVMPVRLKICAGFRKHKEVDGRFNHVNCKRCRYIKQWATDQLCVGAGTQNSGQLSSCVLGQVHKTVGN
jgi:hypothetical protein